MSEFKTWWVEESLQRSDAGRTSVFVECFKCGELIVGHSEGDRPVISKFCFHCGEPMLFIFPIIPNLVVLNQFNVIGKRGDVRAFCK